MEGAAVSSSANVPTAKGTSATAVETSSMSSSAESIIKRLAKGGVAVDHLENGPAGLVEFLEQDWMRVPTAVSAIFPDVDEIKESSASDETQVGACREEFLSLCKEAVEWVRWVLFGGDPKVFLTHMGLTNGGQRGICGAVWGSNDIAYRCRTCEHDPTCAICVACFQAGDHQHHDFAMIFTGGGCCDCGDVTAWKQSGFCSRHRGPGYVPSLPPRFLTSATPVLEAVLTLWASKLNAAQAVAGGKSKKWNLQTAQEKVASQTSLAVTSMLLEFCNTSESLLSFTATHVGMKSSGILDTLLRTECFLPDMVVQALHELLYKLLGDATFKYSFAQAFIAHYPKFLRDSVREELALSPSHSSAKHMERGILHTFSVQIFTVPTLTHKLVLESKLLDMLLETLKELFLACVGDDGRLLVSKGPIVQKLYQRILEDIRYVLSHLEVAQYVALRRPELVKAWVELVAFVQGMYPQRRVLNIHVEEENEDWESAYLLETQMAYIHPLYVLGAACGTQVDKMAGKSLQDPVKLEETDDDADIFRHAKLGRITKDTDGMDVGGSSGVDVEMDDVTNTSCAGGEEFQNTETNVLLRQREGRGGPVTVSPVVPVSLLWLISECTSVLDKWLALDVSRELAKGPGQPNLDSSTSSGQRRGIWRGRARGLTRGARAPASVVQPAAPAAPPAAGADGGPGRGGTFRDWLRRSRRYTTEPTTPDDRRASGVSANGSDSLDMDVDASPKGGRTREAAGREWWMGADVLNAGVAVGPLFGEEWPAVDFDVSRQDVSFHIPLHRMLSILMHKALEYQSQNRELSSGTQRAKSSDHESIEKCIRLCQLLPDKYQVPSFAPLLMEHPLRLQVLCAQVQAGMWRRNGHTTINLCELYRTVPWCEDTFELDLLMLQCCSVLAPPEDFVARIQARFGLAEYFTLSLRAPNEYEPSLAQEFLVLLIRLCSERGFCGLSPVEAVRRELVQRLAVGDATHSSLLKALPRRLQDSKHLEECLRSVATYRNPSGLQQGKYMLREECWRELDLYHPRWSPRELQSAEDRYLRACKASPIYIQLPRWKMPYAPLQGMGRFIISENVSKILRSVFFHAAFSDNLSDSRAPEGLLFAALHLLSLALDVGAFSVPSKSAHDRSEDTGICGSKLSNSEDPNTASFGVFSSRNHERVDGALLMLRSIERVPVYDVDGTLKHESLLSLLVILFRKYGSGEGLPGSLAESSHYTAGDVIKSLLLRFADLDRACMYEIESLLPEILHRRSVELHASAGSSCQMESDDRKAITDAEKRKAIARDRQKAILAKMKAAQDRFVASLQEIHEPENNDTKDKCPSEALETSGCTSEETSTPPCALCRDTGSASPLCFLTLVQKSRILALSQKPTPSWKRPSSEILLSSGERRNDTSGIMSDNVNSNMYTPADLWNWIQEALGDATTRERLVEGEALLEVFRNGLEPGIRNAVRLANAVGMPPVQPSEPIETDVDEAEGVGERDEIKTCQEEGPIYSPSWWEQDPDSRDAEEGSSREVVLATVLGEYVSAVSRERQRQREREPPRTVDVEVGREGGAVRARRLPGRNVMDATVNTGLGLSDTAGVYLSACGHAVHQDCLDRYFSTLLQRYYSRALFEGVQIVDPDMGEFLCPVCRRLANSILPVFPARLDPAPPSGTLASCDLALRMPLSGQGSGPSVMERCNSRTMKLHQAFRLLYNAENMVSKAGFRKAVSTQLADSIKGALETLAVRLHGLFHPDRGQQSGAHGRVPQSLHIWDVFRYSLMSAELASRTKQASSVQGSLSGLLMLEEAADATKGSVLPLLLHAAKATQGQTRQVVLLRSRGMQLLVDSIILGVSRDLLSEKSLQGNFPALKQYLEKSQDSADVQFWKRMADPVLLHDPFSSLLWLLYCLPLPLPSGEAPFSVLVHLFYLVCLTQVIAYAGSVDSVDAEAGSSASTFVTAVQATLSGSVLSPSGESNNFYISAIPAVTVFRRLTLPYLRQCSLLQKLIAGSGQLLPVASAPLWELAQRNGSLSNRQSTDAGGSTINEGQSLLQELEELDQLESLFSIPPLMDILKDDSVQGVVLNWCQHVRGEASTRSIVHIPRQVRAAPFKLMELPHLFQDLLRRYVKECCPRCETVPTRPALCLLCGTLCCGAMSHLECCSVNRQGDCYRHAMACGAGVGVFLMLRTTNILLQRCERQALWPSPYLDAFGEEDLEGRGKPLFLSEKRYAALTAMVVSHGLDYSSWVLSQTTRQILL